MSGSTPLFEIEEKNPFEETSYYFEDTKLSEAELRKKTHSTISANGKIVNQKYSKVQDKLEYGFLKSFQIKNSQIDLEEYESRAKVIVFEKLKKLGKLDEQNNPMISLHMVAIAINQERNNLLKKEVSNRSYYSKSEIMKMAGIAPSNLPYLENVLNRMRSQSECILEEVILDENYENIITNRISLMFISSYGISSVTNDIDEGGGGLDFRKTKKINFSSMKETDRMIVEYDINSSPYLVKAHQLTPIKKQLKNNFIKVLDTVVKFETEYGKPLYKIAEQYKLIWQNQMFTFIELQKRVGTKYGVAKEYSAEYKKLHKRVENEINSLSLIDEVATEQQIQKKCQELIKEEKIKIDKFKKTDNNEFIYLEDNEGNYIYDEDYLKNFKYFKRDVLLKGIADLEDKTNYKIRIIEIRDAGYPLFEYNMALTELIRRKIAVVNETTNTITIGKQKGLLKGVQFEISQKEPAFFKRKAYYKSCSYYAAARLQLDKIIKGEKPIDDLKQYASTIEENWDNGNKWTRPILEINTYQELVLKVTENYDAITEIKGVMSKNYKELAHIAFCEKLMVLYDKSASLKGNAKYKKRLGNDALECLSNLYEYYPDIMEKYNNSSEEITTEDKILEYAPFEFKKSETKFITITKKNITENMYEIEKAIKKGDKKSFKAFRQLSIKKEFYASFFG